MCILNDAEQDAMKMPAGFSRNDVIRIVALVSMVAFPLIADAQLGRGAGAVKASGDVLAAAQAPVKAVVAGRDSCADQHWPFLSTSCLRGSTKTIEPRLVTMNVETSTKSATADASPKMIRSTDVARDSAASARSTKPVKPQVGAHTRERRTSNVTYAVNSDAGRMPLAGW
jgi:hypothetical protein